MQIIPYSDSIIKKAGEYLSESELKYFHDLPGNKTNRPAEWLAGRIAAKQAIQKLIGPNNLPDYKQIEITYSELGQPKYKNINISISHVEDFAAAEAVTHGKVGIDIEHIRVFPKLVYDKFLTEKEKLWLTSLPVEKFDTYTTILWSLKESYLKALGLGIRKSPAEVEFELIGTEFKITNHLLDGQASFWYNIDIEAKLVATKALIS